MLSVRGGTNDPQVTISPTGSINAKGFDILERVPPKTYDERALIFVVPKSIAQGFKCLKPTGDAQNKFQYFVLPLGLDGSKYCPSSADM